VLSTALSAAFVIKRRSFVAYFDAFYQEMACDVAFFVASHFVACSIGRLVAFTGEKKTLSRLLSWLLGTSVSSLPTKEGALSVALFVGLSVRRLDY
jgi:hypothetical protein